MSHTDMLFFMGVTKDATTAGPGKRLELFLKGCIRGIVNPCEGCFNPTSWEFGGLRKEMDIDEVASIILRDAWNRQVTFCGGEPLLQTRNLVRLCRRLKARDPKFHIVVYTAYTIENLLKNGIVYKYRPVDGPEVKEALELYSNNRVKENGIHTIVHSYTIRELMETIDLLVDGDYQAEYRIPTEQYMNDGMFVGSSNQRVIDTQATLRNEPILVFDHADTWMKMHSLMKHCKCCGHELHKRSVYCDADCRARYRRRDKQMALLGGA